MIDPFRKKARDLFLKSRLKLLTLMGHHEDELQEGPFLTKCVPCFLETHELARYTNLLKAVENMPSFDFAECEVQRGRAELSQFCGVASPVLFTNSEQDTQILNTTSVFEKVQLTFTH